MVRNEKKGSIAIIPVLCISWESCCPVLNSHNKNGQEEITLGIPGQEKTTVKEFYFAIQQIQLHAWEATVNAVSIPHMAATVSLNAITTSIPFSLVQTQGENIGGMSSFFFSALLLSPRDQKMCFRKIIAASTHAKHQTCPFALSYCFQLFCGILTAPRTIARRTGECPCRLML